MSTTSDTQGLRSSAVEDYAKAIYALQMRDDQPVSTTALAERLGVTPASASGMVKRLGGVGTGHPPALPRSPAHRRGPSGRARGHPPSPAARALPGREPRRALGSRS